MNKKILIAVIVLLGISLSVGGYFGYQYLNTKNSPKKSIFIAKAGPNVSYKAIGDSKNSECTGMDGYSEVQVEDSQSDTKSILDRLVNNYMKPTSDQADYNDYIAKFNKFKILGYEKSENVGYINLTDPDGFLNGGLSRGNYFRCEFIETVKKNDASLSQVKFRIDGHDVDNYNYFLFQP